MSIPFLSCNSQPMLSYQFVGHDGWVDMEAFAAAIWAMPA